MRINNYSIILFVLYLSALPIISPATNGWTSTAENPKSFIENKGQFQTNNPMDTVLYAYDDGTTMIYFTERGIIYRFMQQLTNDEENEKEREWEKKFGTTEEWKEHEAQEHRIKYKIDYVNFYWENSNSHVQVIAQDQTDDYYSYTFKENGVLRNVNYINGYKKLLYKNLYPNIDAEYVFHPEGGIKYSLIVHPGADISKIKMKYDDDAKLNKNGELHIPTLFGNIIEHAPVTFYAGNSASLITSRFIKTGSTVSFKLGSYDATKTICIDPWVQTPTLSNSNCVWECEKDGSGNVYIIGGDMPMKLRKYTSAGTMQWTYTTPWDTANGWLGTLATDLAGNSYITNGASDAVLQKINSSGSMQYSTNGGMNDEYWNISFNCDQTKLIVGGTRLTGMPNITGDGVIFDINTSNGSINGVQTVGKARTSIIFGMPMTIAEEVRSMTPSRGAKYYFLTLDTIGAISQNFSVCPNPDNLFNINHTYGFGYKCENYRPDNGNSGMKSIKANGNFVYTQNGTTIHKRSLATGAILSSASITGGISTTSAGFNMAGNSGIDIDSCGNVYVGSGNAVIKYDANLNQLSSTSLPFRVYDVAVSYNGDVIVCGGTGDNSNTSRTGYVQSVNMSACDPMILFCCDATICPAGPYCTNDAPVTLTPSTAGGTWSGPGITNASTGAFDPSVAGPGIHTIIYTLSCGSDSIQIGVSCCGASINPVGSFCVADPSTTLTAAQSGGTWSGSGITNASAGTFNPATAGAGTHTIIYTLSGCGSDSISISVGNCVSLTACKETNGDITATSGTAPYNWYNQTTTQDCSACSFGCAFPPGCAVNITSWTSFATGTTITPSGTYPVKLVDNNGDSLIINSLSSLSTCPSTSCPNITTTASNITDASCPGLSDGSFNASTTGGVSPWDYTLKNSGGTTVATFSNIAGIQSFTGLAAGIYTLYSFDTNNCSDTITVTITEPSGNITIANAGPDQSVCSNSAILAGNTPTSGTGIWSLVSGTATITTPSSPTSGVTGITVGTIVLEWTISDGCSSSSDTMTITNTGGGPVVSITSHTDITCSGANDGSATASATGGSGNLTYAWTPNGGNAAIATNLQVGTYTVSVTDTLGCTGIETVTIIEPAIITVNTTTNPAGCSNNGSATATANGGTGTYSYLWNTGETTAALNNLGAGTYTVTVTDSLGCTGTQTATVTSSSGITVNINTSPAGCSNNGSATALANGGTGTLTYLWSSGESTSTINGLSAGTYTVTVTDSAGCTATTTGSVTSTGGITVTISQSDTISVGSSIQLSASGGNSYLWSPAAGLDCNNCQTPVASPIETTIYCVIATDNGCSDTACTTITVVDEDCSTNNVIAGAVYVPNAFTPDNNDILNDVFKPVVNCIHDYKFLVFDRWGEKLFETSNIDEGWDGYYKGGLCKPDVYVYKVYFIDDPKGNYHEYIGRVVLLK